MVILNEACIVLRLQMKEIATICGGLCVISVTKFCIMSPSLCLVWEFIHRAQLQRCRLKHAVKCLL